MDSDECRERLRKFADAAGTCGGPCSQDKGRCVLSGEGPLDVRVMLVGTVPGDEERRAGRLWAGRAGVILDELLEAAGLSREDVYLTNLLKCPRSVFRRPKIAEIEACRPLLESELALVNPAVVATLGYYPTKVFLGWYDLGVPMRREFSGIYGRPIEVGSRLLMPLPNPAALIPAPELADFARRAYRRLGELLGPSVDRD